MITIAFVVGIIASLTLYSLAAHAANRRYRLVDDDALPLWVVGSFLAVLLLALPVLEALDLPI